MDNRKIEVERDKLAAVLDQNREMKQLITEAWKAWNNISEVLDVGSLAAGGNGNIMLKLPKMLSKINRNPEIFNNLVNPDFLQRLKKYVNDELPG